MVAGDLGAHLEPGIAGHRGFDAGAHLFKLGFTAAQAGTCREHVTDRHRHTVENRAECSGELVSFDVDLRMLRGAHAGGQPKRAPDGQQPAHAPKQLSDPLMADLVQPAPGEGTLHRDYTHGTAWIPRGPFHPDVGPIGPPHQQRPGHTPRGKNRIQIANAGRE